MYKENPLFYGGKDILNRKHLIDGAGANGFGIHAEDHRRGLVLGDHVASRILHGLCAASSIIAHSSKDYAHRKSPRVFGGALKSYVRAGTVSKNAWSIVKSDPAGSRNSHVMRAGTDVNRCRQKDFAGVRFLHLHRTGLRKLLAELRCESSGHVLNDQNSSRKLAREYRQKLHQRCRSA